VRAVTRDLNSNATRASRNSGDATDLRFKQNLDKLYRLRPPAIAAIFRRLGATSFCMTEIEQVVAHRVGQRFAGGRHD
jgi:hypothetical protein